MKLQYLPEGSSGSPLIRLFDFDTTEARQLFDTLLPLAERRVQSVALTSLNFVNLFTEFELTAILDDRPRNIDTEYSIVAGPTMTFIWRATAEEWRRTCEALVPFTRHCDAYSYAWLTEDLGVQVLVSASGSW